MRLLLRITGTWERSNKLKITFTKKLGVDLNLGNALTIQIRNLSSRLLSKTIV
jgi:hypothetical protein